MAKAVIRGGLNQVRTLKYKHNADVAAGDIIVVNGQVLVAVNTALANTDNIYVFRGPVEFPKEASLAVAAGEKCYFVTANGNVNKTASGNTEVGVAKEASATTDTVVLVELGENR